MERSVLASYLDSTLLRPEAASVDVIALCTEAHELGVFAVCVSPTFVTAAHAYLAYDMPGSNVQVAAVCGFPSGAVDSDVKGAEARLAALNGADEIDMVINLGAVKDGNWAAVERDIAAVRVATMGPRALLKVIIESAALTDSEIVRVCKIAEDSGADFVKTSTGFHPAGGASVHAVGLMRSAVSDRLGVKASGGIRTFEQAVAMIEAGANRLGVSAARQILDGGPDQGSGY
jgi:deoxyribose-phosphate aldolase